MKPGHLILKVLWISFILIAFCACCISISSTLEQYYQTLSTTTLIKRHKIMTLPSITFCSKYSVLAEDMLLKCTFGINSEPCLTDKLNISYRRTVSNCIRLNFGSNASILQRSEGEGYPYGYAIYFYIPKKVYLNYALYDNNFLVVESEINNVISPGHQNDVMISKSTHENLGKL